VITHTQRERERVRVFSHSVLLPSLSFPTVFVCFELFSEHYLRRIAMRALSLHAILFYRPDDRAHRRHYPSPPQYMWMPTRFRRT
jgi:hypothetical protein